jgi:excisionase family DNA binding protein
MSHRSSVAADPADSTCKSAPLLLHLPEPIGWFALTLGELATAQARALESLPPAQEPRVRSDALRRPRLLSADEAASALSVEATWLLRQARERRIEHVRLGKYVRFDLDAIVGHCTKYPERRS